MKYVIYLDDFSQEIFYEMESISEGVSAHECVVLANSKEEATEKLLANIKEFIKKQLINVEN